LPLAPSAGARDVEPPKIGEDMRGAQVIAKWEPPGGGHFAESAMETFAEEMTQPAVMVLACSKLVVGRRVFEARRTNAHRCVSQIWARNPLTDTGSNPAPLSSFWLAA